MPRSKPSQSKHDQKVAQEAKRYEHRGYEVQADLPGYFKPDPVGGFVPDITATKGGHETIVEVETPDSVRSSRDVAQQGAFQRAARRSEKKHYRRLIAK